jgi:hypothetical protein
MLEGCRPVSSNSKVNQSWLDLLATEIASASAG